MAQTGVLVTTHGANCVNGMFLPEGAVFIEVYLHPFWPPCFWGEFLDKLGVSYLRWCHGGACVKRRVPTAYPRDDAVIKPQQLERVVARAVHMVREDLQCVYTKDHDCVPHKAHKAEDM